MFNSLTREAIVAAALGFNLNVERIKEPFKSSLSNRQKAKRKRLNKIQAASRRVNR